MGLDPKMMQDPAFLQFVAQAQKKIAGNGGGKQTEGPGGNPIVSPGQSGTNIGAPPPPIAPGGSAGIRVPNPQGNSVVAQAGVPNLANAGPPGQLQTEFQSNASRNMAITDNAIKSLAQFGDQLKTQKHQKTVAQAEQATGAYVTLQQEIAGTDDPAKKKLLQEKLDEIMKDPKVSKILQKASDDPTSPEGQGMQRALEMAKKDAADKAQAAEIHAQMLEHQAKAREDDALAADHQREAQLRGTYTDADKGKDAAALERAKVAAGAKENEVKLVDKGPSPAVEYQHITYGMDAINKKDTPPEVRSKLQAVAQSEKAKIKENFDRQARGFDQQIKMWGKNIDERHKQQVDRIASPAIKADAIAGHAQQLADTYTKTNDQSALTQLADLAIGQPTSKMTQQELAAALKNQGLEEKIVIALVGGKPQLQMKPEDAQALAAKLKGQAKIEYDSAQKRLQLEKLPELPPPTFLLAPTPEEPDAPAKDDTPMPDPEKL